MFPDSYFAPRYFAPRYFPRPISAPTPTPTPTTTAEEVHLLEPLYIWDERDMLKREEEEVFFIL